MSNAAANATAFYREVAKSGSVWTIRDSAGYPAPETGAGRRAQPFWSTRARAEAVVAAAAAYRGFEVVQITWAIFRERWLPGLAKDGLLVGVNWGGPTARGYDLEPQDLLANVEHARSSRGE